MAKYTVTRACGHEERVSLGGRRDRREWLLENVEPNKLCYECYQEKIQKEREEKNKKAAEEAKKQGLPELTGSEKQIAWAETIRQNILDKIDETLEGIPEEKKKIEKFNHLVQGIAEIEKKTSASWWIDNRFNTSDRDVLRLAAIMYDAMPKQSEKDVEAKIKIQEEKEKMRAKEEAKAEATVIPEDPKTELVAEIRALESHIEISFPERRNDFYDIVKNNLEMSWDRSNYHWIRRMNDKTGTPADRAAEAGHYLLAAGFPIRIYDPELRQKAITSDYEPECKRWIMARVEGKYDGWFVIKTKGNDMIYKAARRIGGSKYDRPNIVVPPEKFEEVLDFAEMYKFRLSDGALEVIEKAKHIKEKAIVADVEPPENETNDIQPNKPPVLDIPEEVGVADELKD